MVFNLEELEKKFNNIEKISNEAKIIKLNDNSLDKTFLYNKDSVTELYILFIVFSLMPLESIQFNDYDVD